MIGWEHLEKPGAEETQGSAATTDRLLLDDQPEFGYRKIYWFPNYFNRTILGK